ncbi:MAG: endonuclease III [Acetobacteraceae bacterium]|nr:endonuclease III [Acetobacteraceae bacterium]MBV8590245.1 endonuclease III [Acetobacteraceae bacterium]
MPEADARQFLAALARANPNPQTELHYRDPFTLLVAVVLSAQTTDAAVNRVTQDLFAVAPTPEAMVRLGVEGVARYTQPLGFWQTKARNVVALSQQLIDRFNGKVPDTREALEALPGVGRKSANVVLNVAFGQSTMPVDTHVFRVANRTGLAHGESPFEVEEGLIRRVPPEMLREAHHLLILHGRYVCKARRPECWRCAGAPWCRYPAKTPAASGKAEEGRPASRRSR